MDIYSFTCLFFWQVVDLVKESISLVDPLNVSDPEDPEFFGTTKLVSCKCKNGARLPWTGNVHK